MAAVDRRHTHDNSLRYRENDSLARVPRQHGRKIAQSAPRPFSNRIVSFHRANNFTLEMLWGNLGRSVVGSIMVIDEVMDEIAGEGFINGFDDETWEGLLKWDVWVEREIMVV